MELLENLPDDGITNLPSAKPKGRGLHLQPQKGMNDQHVFIKFNSYSICYDVTLSCKLSQSLSPDMPCNRNIIIIGG